jgi:hypothetical protein
MAPTIDHFTADTLPRVIAGAGAPAPPDLLLPFRVTTGDPGLRVVSWRLDVEVDGRIWSSWVRTRLLPAGLTDDLRDTMSRTGVYSFDHLPYYAALDDAGVRSGEHTYIEALVRRPPVGGLVRYALKVTLRAAGAAPVAVTSRTWTTSVVDPRFGRDDVRHTFVPEAGRAEDAWVLMHRRADGVDQIRVDVLELTTDGATPDRAPLVVEVDGRTVVDLAAGPDGGPETLPLVDLAADSVTVAVPHDEGAPLPRVAVRYRGSGDTVDLGRRVPVGETRLVFVNVATHGLDDLFTVADVDYRPPRTHTQVTMRDEAASYRSRPGGAADRVGYTFTVDAHRRFRVPQMWAMNGGLLGLLAHDAPGDLAQMAAAVDEGTLVPVVAGYGAHLLPYASKATNLDAIAFGSDALRNILGATRPVYHPHSRVTVEEVHVTDALRAAGMDFLVVDGGDEDDDGQGGSHILIRDPSKKLGTQDDEGRWVTWQYPWHDRAADATVLFVDPELTGRLLTSTPEEADRGTVTLALRRKFLELAAQPIVRAGNLVVYCDDAAKAGGRADGDGRPDNQRYQAALSWVAAHPWVRAVTTDDLADDDCIGELDLVRSTDPAVRRLPGFGDGELPNALPCDTWYLTWARTRAAWLGDTLGAVSDRAEKAIARRRDCGHGAELVLLARLYYLMCLHGPRWSERADPDDVVVAASLQIRNVHVLLNASIWAEWAAAVAAGREKGGTHRDDGPVVARVAAFERACLADEDGIRPAWWREEHRGLQWDHDPLPNVVLYTEHALVVLDRNGGRVTHLFALVDGRPCALSGTHKAAGSLTYDWLRQEGAECDGIVLQNTVCTPNHTYVACDVEAAQPTGGAPASPDAELGRLHPDNFNAYDETDAIGAAVTFDYGDGTPGAVPPVTVAELEAALAADRAEKVAGRRGLVLHDTATFGRFTKSVRLEGRTVHVEYEDTRPGHRVANEFCVDLRAAALDGRRQSTTVDADGRGAAVTNDAGLAVRVELDGGCVFSPGLAAGDGVEARRLHRVMTDDLEIVAPDGGDFAYRIMLP